MLVNTESMVSVTEANRNSSRVARLVDQNGAAVILKNDTPRYLVLDFSQREAEQSAATEDVMTISERILAKNQQAYAVLAK